MWKLKYVDRKTLGLVFFELYNMNYEIKPYTTLVNVPVIFSTKDISKLRFLETLRGSGTFLRSLGPHFVIPIAPIGAVIKIDSTTIVSTFWAHEMTSSRLLFLANSKATGPSAAYTKELNTNSVVYRKWRENQTWLFTKFHSMYLHCSFRQPRYINNYNFFKS